MGEKIVMKILKKARNGQEEIMGFVLIVVLLVIVGVIFLGIRLRNPEHVQRESELIYRFIESSMEQTTDCKTSESGNFWALDSLIRDCHTYNNECTSGDKTCDIVENTLKDILNSTWQVGPDFPFKGYEVEISYSFNSSGQQQFDSVLNLSSGLCSSSYSGSSYGIPEPPGHITTKVKICS